MPSNLVAPLVDAIDDVEVLASGSWSLMARCIAAVSPLRNASNRRNSLTDWSSDGGAAAGDEVGPWLPEGPDAGGSPSFKEAREAREAVDGLGWCRERWLP